MRIIVTGLIGTYPLGGVAWDYLHYVGGFNRLGHEVLYLEDTGHWLYDPESYTYTDDAAKNARYLAKVLKSYVPQAKWALRDPKDEYWGMTGKEVSEWCRSADLFLNVSGSCWLREQYRGARCKVYLDSDPSYSQARIRQVITGRADGDTIYSVDRIREHDRHFSFAENIGTPDCLIPTDLFQWKTTRQPIVLEWWNHVPQVKLEDRKRWSTVMSWKIDEKPPQINDQQLGGKDVEFEPYKSLPQERLMMEGGIEFSLAVSGRAPREQLVASGWKIIDGYSVSSSPEVYKDYIAASAAEWSIAKQAYVATHSGWFSCRTACYLAAGRPAVVQDTTWSRYIPAGRGLFAFNSLEEARAQIMEVDRNYESHSWNARRMASEYFDSDLILKKFLSEL